MNSGRVDVFTSRRTNYNKCRYWIARDEVNGTSPTDYDIDSIEDGVFYAREENSEVFGYQVVANDVLFEEQNIMISTMDDVHDLIVNSMVEYNDEKWRVADIQRVKQKKQNQLSKIIAYKYFISLRR